MRSPLHSAKPLSFLPRRNKYKTIYNHNSNNYINQRLSASNNPFDEFKFCIITNRGMNEGITE